ncbi:hypothetical protein DdX_12834 [Ditylenchus destructor]|uniref:Uncharacterized protein n=1 Tax=Ditylenchus destructor TaxID=166010 RepID=A0AAD4MV12_9BILA|nr:hypothetical protein DdX_12834 [Ditylenchus destructor]
MLVILIVALFVANGIIAPKQTIEETVVASMSFDELSRKYNYRPPDHQNKPSNIPITLRNTRISTLHFDGITKVSTIGDLKKRMIESNYLLQGDTFKALVKKGLKTEYVSYDDGEVLGHLLDKFTSWPPTFFANIFVFVLHLSRSRVIELERFRDDSKVGRLRSRLKRARDIQDGDMLSTFTTSNYMIPLYDDDELDKIPFKESPPQFYINMYTVIIHGYSSKTKRRPVDVQGVNKYHKVKDLKRKLMLLRLVKETDVLATFVQGQEQVKILRDNDTVFDIKFKNLPPDIYLYDNSKDKKESSMQIRPVRQKTRSQVPTRTPRCYYCKDKRCYYDEGKDPFMERVHFINGELRYGSEIASFAIKYSACQACELQNGEWKGYSHRSLPYYRERMSNFNCYSRTDFMAYAEKHDPKPKARRLPVAPPPTPQSTPAALMPELYKLILHTADGHKKPVTIDGLASDDNVGLLKVQLRNLGHFNEGDILKGLIVISGTHTEEIFDNSAILSDIYFTGTPEFKVSKSHDQGVDLVSSQPNPAEVRASRNFTAANEITVRDEMMGIYSQGDKAAESDPKHTSNSVRASTRFQAKTHAADPGTPGNFVSF